MLDRVPLAYPALEKELILEIAMAIHNEYNKQRLSERPDVPLEHPRWDELPLDLKTSNIDQAEDIPEKMNIIGCFVSPKKENMVHVISFEKEELEILAIREHERWVEERKASGWVYGEVKDVARKMSPYIAPWDDIPDEIKKYDEEAVVNIIPLLNKANLCVYRKNP
jgi:RyR domain.